MAFVGAKSRELARDFLQSKARLADIEIPARCYLHGGLRVFEQVYVKRRSEKPGFV